MAPSTETDRQIESNNQTVAVLRLLYSSGRVAPLDLAEFPIQSLVLSRAGVLLGREVSPKEGIPLPADKRASATHVRIAVTEDGTGVLVRDLGSKNGTYVNGEAQTEVRLSLAQPAVLRVGNSLFVLRGIRPAVWESSRHAPLVRSQALLSGTSEEMELLRYLLLCAAEHESAVLLSGETGTGKELAAQLLHSASARRERAFVAINCANIAESLAESQLFGHVAGAFTGAKAPQQGWFRQAHGGTLFLDEVGELPLPLQPKLLRALEEGQIWPVGAREPVPVDVRVVSATNRDLDDAVARGLFRADLLARLAVLRVGLPRLATRIEDILPLFLRRLGRRPLLSARLAEALLLFPWPMNVRQLFSVAEHAAAFAADAEELDLPLFAERLAVPQPGAQNFGASAAERGGAARPRTAAARPGIPALVAAPSSSTPEGTTPAERSADLESCGADAEPSASSYAEGDRAKGGDSEVGKASYSPEVLARLLREKGGNISLLSRLLGISRRTLNRWIDRAGLRSEDFRAASSVGTSMLDGTASEHEPKDAAIELQRRPRD